PLPPAVQLLPARFLRAAPAYRIPGSAAPRGIPANGQRGKPDTGMESAGAVGRCAQGRQKASLRNRRYAQLRYLLLHVILSAIHAICFHRVVTGPPEQRGILFFPRYLRYAVIGVSQLLRQA